MLLTLTYILLFAAKLWGRTAGDSVFYFPLQFLSFLFLLFTKVLTSHSYCLPIQFISFRRITALHTCANNGYIVVEDENYWDNLGGTVLKIYDVAGSSYPWSIDYIIIGI